MSNKKALISGVTGQDGSYLAEFLLYKGYEVHGIMRRASSFNTGRLDGCFDHPNFILHRGDITDGSSMNVIMNEVRPDEVYNFGSQSHVRVSFDIPVYTAEATGNSTLILLEIIRRSKIKCKFYQASSSEIFGSSPPPQNENTPFRPRSPYACAKLFAHWNTVNYREGYGMFACNGILMNHESPRRGNTFVTKKITKAVANIIAGKQEKLLLGNLDAKRDWGYAPEFVKACWLMLQQDEPDDYVVATGETHSVREFVELAFGVVDLDWQKYVEISEDYYRPTEVDVLQGDYSKAKKVLGWEPETTFEGLVEIMVKADLEEIGMYDYTS